MSVLIKTQINQKIVVTCVYIPPNSLNNATFESLQSYLDGLTLGPETDLIVCGDFNVNFLLTSTKRKKIEDNLIGNGMLENKMSCLPTRVTERSSTLIDFFFCTSSFSTKTIKNSVSDNFGVQFFSNFLKKDVFKKKTFARNWNKLKKRDISEKLSFYLQHEIGKCMQLWNPEDPQMSSRILEKINSILMKAVDTFSPKRLLVQSERHPWIDNEVKNAATKKRRLRQEFLNIKTTDARNKYSSQNKNVKNLIIRKKRKYYQNKLMLESNCKMKTFFETFKEMSGKGKKSKSLNLSNGDAEHFNEYFANIGARLTQSKPNCIENNVIRQQQSLFYVSSNINKYSTDFYDINTVLVNHLKTILAGPLTEIFNDCLTSGIYPNCLKIAKIVPIFKEGDIDDPSDYRPISLLPVLGKIFERIIFKRAQSYVDKFNIIRNTQFGFKSNRSTVDAILTLLEEISTSLSNKKLTVQNTFLDLTKAFDTVDHSSLLIKLEQMGFRGPVLNLLESYLDNRYQYIETNSFKTELKLVSFGVPQGSILGPLLFILYINDLQIATKNTGVLLYADDTVLKSTNNKDYIAFAHRSALLK